MVGGKFKKSLFGILVLSFFFISCKKSDYSNKAVLKHLKGNALGTTYSILYFDENSSEVALQSSIVSIMDKLNASVSTYHSGSLISKFNAYSKLETKQIASFQLDTLFTEIFKISKKAHQLTQGYFDPTIGPLVNAWGFGPQKNTAGNIYNVLKDKTIDSLKAFLGFDKLKLLPTHKLVKPHSNLKLDFNAVAKGYSVDLVAKHLETIGITNYLIEIGGELRGKGIRLDTQKPWRVGIDDPTKSLEDRGIYQVVPLKDQSMATSGNYRKFWKDPVTGEKRVHVIDPKTGNSRASNVLSVSVIAANCALADAVATGLLAAPFEELKLIATSLSTSSQIDVFVIYLNTKHEIKVFKTSKLLF